MTTTPGDTNVNGTTPDTGSDTNVTENTGMDAGSSSSKDGGSTSSTGTGSRSTTGSSTDGSGTSDSSSTDGRGTDSSGSTGSTTTTTNGITETLVDFTSATDARAEATSWPTIDAEVKAIETEITAAIAANKFSVLITDTAMTSTTSSSSLPYFRVHHGLDIGLQTSYDQMHIHEQIRSVKQNFTNLGYVFQILDNSNYPNVLMWLTMW